VIPSGKLKLAVGPVPFEFPEVVDPARVATVAERLRADPIVMLTVCELGAELAPDTTAIALTVRVRPSPATVNGELYQVELVVGIAPSVV
jgi:hypothetical protein